MKGDFEAETIYNGRMGYRPITIACNEGCLEEMHEGSWTDSVNERGADLTSGVSIALRLEAMALFGWRPSLVALLTWMAKLTAIGVGGVDVQVTWFHLVSRL